MTRIIYTNQTSKKKKKPNAKQRELAADWEKLLKKWEVKPNEKSKTVRKEYLQSVGPVVPAGRESSRIPSMDTGLACATVSAPKMYTGDKMLGIGQMHKSNAVPIFKQEDAEDLARMRR